MVNVRLLQVESDETESVNARIARVISQLSNHLENTEFLVLPELWTIHAFNLSALKPNAFSLEDDLFKKLSQLSKSSNTWLHAGSFPIINSDGTVSNISVIFNNKGEISTQYSKIYLYGFAEGEKKYLAPGSAIVVANTLLGETGISTCYDLRFPELYREQMKIGATTFLLCAGWPTVRQEHWINLIKSRAIENQCFVVAVNGRGTFENIKLAGNSLVVDPRGNVIAQAGAEDEYIDAEIDLELVNQWRKDFPVLLDQKDLHSF